MRHWIIISLFILMNHVSLAQESGEFVVEINNVTGDYIKPGPPIGNITWVYVDESTMDENSGIFIFQSAQPDHRLFSISTADGSVIHNPYIEKVWSLQFDNSTGTLYGIEQDNANNQKFFVSVDPTTGSATHIGAPISGSAILQGKFSSLYETGQTYTFLTPLNILNSLNTNTGSIISNPTITLPPEEFLLHISYDNSSGILYGLLKNNSLSKYYLVIIDPNSGLVSKVGDGTLLGAANGNGSIDETNQTYTYLYTSEEDNSHYITTIDLTTGLVVEHALVHMYQEYLNFNSMVFDNIGQKYFSLHWDPVVLPLTLIDFSVHAVEMNLIQINWTTSGEHNIDFYTVERSKDGIVWAKVPVDVKANNSSEIFNYKITDSPNVTGTLYYRIKIHEMNGIISFSPIKQTYVTGKDNKAVSIFPVPAQEEIIVKGPKSELVKIDVYTIEGHSLSGSISFRRKGLTTISIDISSLPRGYYLIKTNTQNNLFIKK